ncbi:hypothetical protein B0H14DRAFT_2648914 [Mycena olivaceomarginata]|nr:hypothetical protein B0H14DRAFT_2648914 [Mycena olivaceomarginata]
MASVVRYGYPFAETEKPPPPVVLLLLQTDLNVSTSTGLVIHEDLDNPVPSAKKTVVFAPVLEHAYPPPPISEEKIPTPTMLTRKTTVHSLVDKLLDTTKSLSDQDPELVQEVFCGLHPDLGKYENNWARRCIVQVRLKATSSNASNKTAREVVADVIQMGRRTRTKSNKQYLWMCWRSADVTVQQPTSRASKSIDSEVHPINPISGERPVRSTAFDQKLLSYSCKDIDVWRIEISKSMDEMDIYSFFYQSPRYYKIQDVTSLVDSFKYCDLPQQIHPRYCQVHHSADTPDTFKIIKLAMTLPILLAFFVRSPASLEFFGMPGLDLRGRKVGGFRYLSSFVAAPDFATIAPQKIHVPGGKNNITGNHSQMRKRPEGGMRPERAAGRKKTRQGGNVGSEPCCVGGWKELKTVERGTETLQAYNVLQCWWLVRGVQRLAVLVVGQSDNAMRHDGCIG